MPLLMSDEYLDALMPSHIALDRRGTIMRMGPSLLHHLGVDPTGHKLTRFFEMKPFRKTLSPTRKTSTRQVQLKGRAEGEGLLLRGSAVPNKDVVYLMIRHIPVNPGEIGRRSLRFDDFSPTDSAMDMQIASKLYSALMTEARTLGAEVTEKRALAEAASVAKSQFLATMSHELRTPLNGMLGMAQVLGGRDLPAKDQEMVDIMIRSGEALLQILNDVLDITKIEAGRVDLDPGEEDFAAIVTQIANLHEASAVEKGLGFSLEIAENFPSLAKIDGLRAGQCLSNIVSNAIKFTSDGSVSVRLASEPLPDGHLFRIEVRDTGIGICDSVRETLFEPFTQADSSTTRNFGGTGLGLSIACNLAGMMGGDISVDSKVGAGSTFHIALKAALAEASSQQPDRAAA